ncbi:hypothetical protein VPH35_003981 [Triticum aestivum]
MAALTVVGMDQVPGPAASADAQICSSVVWLAEGRTRRRPRRSPREGQPTSSSVVKEAEELSAERLLLQCPSLKDVHVYRCCDMLIGAIRNEVSRGSGSRFLSNLWLRKVDAPWIQCKVSLFFPNAAVILELQKQGREWTNTRPKAMDFLLQSGDLL